MSRFSSSPDAESESGQNNSLLWRAVSLLMLASAWGMIELIGGETIYLVAAALLLLAAARSVVNRAGSSTAVAAVAVLFKSVNTAPHPCHLAGIALLGVAFDISATLLLRTGRREFLRAVCAGAASAYLSCFFFAASMVWIFQYRGWPDGGFARVAEHTWFSGGRGAIAGMLTVPLGLYLARLVTRQAAGHPRTALWAAAAASVAIWAFGPLAG